MSLLAASAGSALANEFVAGKYKTEISEATPVRSQGKSVEPSAFGEEGFQEFSFGAYKVGCEKASSKGEVTESPSTSFVTTIKYAKCGYYPIVKGAEHLPAQVTGGFTVKFLANGALDTIGNPELEEQEFITKHGPEPVVELLETSLKVRIPGAKFCELFVPAQVVPFAEKESKGYDDVAYANDEVPIENETPGRLKLWPGGIEHKIFVTLDLKAVKVKLGSESQCGEDEKSTEKTGSIKGTLKEEVPGGNIEFLEGPVA